MRRLIPLALIATLPVLTPGAALAGGFRLPIPVPPIPIPVPIPRFPGARDAQEAAARLLQLEGERDRLLRQVVWRVLEPSTNRGQVQAAIARQGFVVWGVELDHEEYYRIAQAIGASVATGNAGPVYLYAQEYVHRTAVAVQRQLQNLGEHAARMVAGAARQALLDALGHGRTSTLVRLVAPGQRIEVYAGVATYNWEKRVGASFPVIRNGRIEWDPQERRFPLPNTFQPYVVVRFFPFGR